jgi:hypothetical protein
MREDISLHEVITQDEFSCEWLDMPW